MRVPEATCPGDATGDRFDSSSKFESTTKLWRLWPWLLQPAEHQVNFLLLLLLQEREGTTSLPRRRRGTTDARDSFARQPKPTGEAQLVPFHNLPNRRSLLWNDEAYYSLFSQTTMEPLPHGLWSCSSKPLTGRTGHRLRDASVYWNHWRYSLYHRNTPTTGQGLIAPAMTCLVGLPSIEATPAPATGTTRHHLATRHHTSQETDFASTLRIKHRSSGH